MSPLIATRLVAADGMVVPVGHAVDAGDVVAGTVVGASVVGGVGCGNCCGRRGRGGDGGGRRHGRRGRGRSRRGGGAGRVAVRATARACNDRHDGQRRHSSNVHRSPCERHTAVPTNLGRLRNSFAGVPAALVALHGYACNRSRPSCQPLQTPRLCVPVCRDLRRLPQHLRLRTARCAACFATSATRGSVRWCSCATTWC